MSHTQRAAEHPILTQRAPKHRTLLHFHSQEEAQEITTCHPIPFSLPRTARPPPHSAAALLFLQEEAQKITTLHPNISSLLCTACHTSLNHYPRPPPITQEEAQKITTIQDAAEVISQRVGGRAPSLV